MPRGVRDRSTRVGQVDPKKDIPMWMRDYARSLGLPWNEAAAYVCQQRKTTQDQAAMIGVHRHTWRKFKNEFEVVRLDD